MKKITVVTVNYNSYKHTLALMDNLESIVKATQIAINLVIVDNGSTKENLENLELRMPCTAWVKLYKNPQNVGYFRGLNIGLEQTSSLEQDYNIICNNDITFDHKFFENLSKLVPSKDTFVIAPRVTTIDGREQNPHVLDGISRFRLFCYDLYFLNYYLGYIILKVAAVFKKQVRPLPPNLTAQNIYMGIGACYILTQEFMKKCKKLDDRVFLWGEEALLAGQVEAANGTTLYAPSLRVFHSESISVSTIPNHKAYLIKRISYKIYRQYLRR